jgi:hypothetical protein
VDVAALRAKGRVRLRFSGDVAVATNTPLLPHNPARVLAVITNNDATTAARLTRKPPAATTTGTPLDSAGGTQSRDYQTEGDSLSGEFWAAGPATLYVEDYEVFE